MKWLGFTLLAASALEIPLVPVSVTIAGQAITIGVSGRVLESVSESENGLRLNVHAQMADFQAHLTSILQAEPDRSDRCGERISVEDAALAPAEPSANLTTHLPIEKWVCSKAFGKENARRPVGGNAIVEMKLTPRNTDGCC